MLVLLLFSLACPCRIPDCTASEVHVAYTFDGDLTCEEAGVTELWLSKDDEPAHPYACDDGDISWFSGEETLTLRLLSAETLEAAQWASPLETVDVPHKSSVTVALRLEAQ